MSNSTRAAYTDSPPADHDGRGTLVRRLLGQAWPVLIGQWAGIAFGVLDTVMTGHASPTDLAAMALAVAINVTVFVGLMGVVHALIPILAQRLGAGQREEVGSGWGQGVWLALLLSGFGMAILLFPHPLLALSGDLDPAVRDSVLAYLIALAFALPAALVFRTMYALGAAVSRPKVIMRITVIGVGFKALLNWLLIFGNLGFPALGAVGAGIATALVFWISLGLGALVLRHDAYFQRFRLRIGRPRWSEQRELLRLGLPMGASYLIEVMAFTFMALMVAREGIATTGAHQIISNLAALCYMAPMALGIATSAQVAQALGARQWQAAQRLGHVGYVLVLIGVALTVAVLLGAREYIVGRYTNSLEVAAFAMPLLVVLPLFHLADAVHAMTLYLLRAYRIAVVPMLLQAIALGCVGLLGGWWLAYGPGAGTLAPLIAAIAPGAPTGAATLWLMATTGLLLSCALMLPVYRRALRLTLQRAGIPLTTG